MSHRPRRSFVVETLLLTTALLSGFALAGEHKQVDVEIFKERGQAFAANNSEVDAPKVAEMIVSQTNVFRDEQ